MTHTVHKATPAKSMRPKEAPLVLMSDGNKDNRRGQLLINSYIKLPFNVCYLSAS